MDEFENLAAAVSVCVLEEATRKIRYIVIVGISRFETFELGVSRQSVQVICNDLFSRNLIEFTENSRHKRSKLAVLTEPGHRAFQRAQQNEYQVIELLFPYMKLHFKSFFLDQTGPFFWPEAALL